MKSCKTNPQLIATIDTLKAKTRETEAAIWRDIALRLEKPKRNWAEANLSKLERYAQDGETIVVPGKVLAAGNISKKITVAAYDFSPRTTSRTLPPRPSSPQAERRSHSRSWLSPTPREPASGS